MVGFTPGVVSREAYTTQAYAITVRVSTKIENLNSDFIILHARGCFGYTMQTGTSTSMPSIRIIFAMVIKFIS